MDYTIYLGGALREDNGFDPLYLKNLRLWQLMVACGVALRVERLKTRLPVTLDITNLILIQHAPLSIRFRFDEKRFDVDGAYNVRYEIIKKRIDKALIRGTEERLTQPGKIAIVYSHAAEASVKITMQTRRNRLRPKTAPSQAAPAGNSKWAKPRSKGARRQRGRQGCGGSTNGTNTVVLRGSVWFELI